MAERQWTGPQWDAITARGGSVLVSAAAGSGKTAVLVERAVGLLCDPVAPVDADRLLVVTFSRAAAAEMKQRMGERLAELIRKDPGNQALLRQQALLAGAQISTVDAFCLDLVRQNFQNLSISPDFSILDQSELEIMQNDCVSDCIASFYEREDDEALHQLVELLSAGRDDRQLAETILRIYGFSRSHPFFEEWMDSKVAMYATDQEVADTVWGQSLLHHARESIAYCLGLTEACLDAVSEDEKMEKAYQPAFQSDLEGLERLSALAGAGDWDGLVAALRGFSFARLGTLRGEDPVKDRVKAARDEVKATVKSLATKSFNADSREFREDLEDLRPKIELLFAMVADFAERLWQAKSEKKRLDFADLEHLALALLVERTGDGYHPSAHALEIAEQYDHVLVDEYQDTNEVQDMIFTCVSRQQQNQFFVGDVKQSIYGFRQAMPEIFMKKKEVFYPYAARMYPAKITLDKNFRSRDTVTGAVNSVFGLIMSRDCGGVDYVEDERLACGATYPAYEHAAPELLLIDASGYEGDKDNAAIEAGEIARTIRAMLRDGYLVEEKGAMRPATLRDFCILMRSPRGRTETYVKELGRWGIAATAENAGGFLAAREVSAVVSLLRALDNPLLDIELTAAMLSPLFDFTADDLAAVRLRAPGKPIYTALCQAEAEGEEKAGDFLALFRRLRTRSALLSADRLIMELYDETGALAVFQAMGMGESRRANLLLLIEYAADYHAMGYKQLGGFVGFLGRLAERGGDLAPAAGGGDGADAVRIMSIHRSKGLEFPVVFLADTAKQFNKVDLRQSTLLHAKYGFACVRRDYQSFRQYPTVPMQAIRLEAQRTLVSEEMRILYVAMTRAREKLIVTGVAGSKPQRRLGGLACPLQDGRLPVYQVSGCGCYLDWVLMALLHHPSCGSLREFAGLSDLELTGDQTRWQAIVVEYTEDRTPETAQREADSPTAPPDPGLLETLRQRSAWRYPFQGETKVPAKLSVSEASKSESARAYLFRARPRFLTAAKLSPTERGNAMHKFMQFADYQLARENLEREADRMMERAYLSAAERESLQLDKLRRFFASNLADRIFASENVYRELKFMTECGQDMLRGVVEGIMEGKVVLQGIADCVFLEDGGAVIVDYKTDRVGDEGQLRDRYHKQLELYRDVLAQSLNTPVKECVLYSFHLDREVKL